MQRRAVPSDNTDIAHYCQLPQSISSPTRELAQIVPYDPEAEEGESRSDAEDPGVLRSAGGQRGALGTQQVDKLLPMLRSFVCEQRVRPNTWHDAQATLRPMRVPRRPPSPLAPRHSLRPHSRSHSRSPLDPSDRLPTQPQRVGCIQQPPLRPLQDPPLLHQVLQHGPSLRDVPVDTILALLEEGVFAQRKVLARRRGVVGLIQRGAAEGGFVDWGRRSSDRRGFAMKGARGGGVRRVSGG
jgi:hypothetical protein